MGVRTPEEDKALPAFRPSRPPAWQAVLLGLVVFIGLVANGRPIGSGDARATERVAASLLGERDFDLDEYPEVTDPFARTVNEHRRSIYPVLSGVAAVPVFAVARAAFVLDETGLALAGKWAASLFSALATALFFLWLGARHPTDRAAGCAALFAFGTTLWSTSQALWQHPFAVLCLCAALLCLQQAEYDPRWFSWVGLPLGLMVAARHADVVLAAVIVGAVALRKPDRVARLVLWTLPAVLFLLFYQWAAFGSPLAHGFSGSASRFSAPWGEGHLGLLLSPAKGLLVFTPVAICGVVGLVRVFRGGERWLAGSLAAAAVAHWVLVGRWSEWHGGESFGPRMMTDALPLLLAFLPEGFFALPAVASWALAAVSVAVQALGAFSYDYSWERAHQRPPANTARSLWSVAESPLVFHARRRVVIAAVPGVVDGRAVVREHPLVLGGARGSRVQFAASGPVVSGAENTLEDVHLQRGARVLDGRALLRGRWDGVFLRVAAEARARKLELRVTGRGRGTLYVGERTFWSAAPRWTAYPIGGAVRIRHPYEFATSGGGDLLVTIGKSVGEADIESIALVSPGEPDKVYRQDGS
jgi:hypothetical protein